MYSPKVSRGILFACLWLTVSAASAAETYMAPEDFVAKAFGGEPPAPRTVWLIEELGEAAAGILSHPPRRLRERYWLKDGRSVWILEEIGKERPITVGWIVEQGEIVATEVLIYRESRGWEVRYPFFKRQFRNARLRDDRGLDREIDNISGATLSVNAMQRMARLALLLHEHAVKGNAP